MEEMIIINGAYGEGGAQVLRTSLALSLLTGQSFRMHSIRANRVKPGLREQQRQILSAILSLSSSQATGNYVGSECVTFRPGKINGGCLAIRPATTVSIPLLLQAMIPVAHLAPAPSSFQIWGGTDVENSPSMDYFREVIVPFIHYPRVTIVRRGFFPLGGGIVNAEVTPAAGTPLKLLLRGDSPVERIRVFSIASLPMQPNRIVERQLNSALEALSKTGVHTEGVCEYYDTASEGSVVTVVAYRQSGERLGSRVLGAADVVPEESGTLAAKLLLDEISFGAGADSFAADTLVPWLAIRGGEIVTSRLSEHTLTNIWICEQFLGSIFDIEGNTIKVDSPYRRPHP